MSDLTGERVPVTVSGDPTCSTCGEVIHRDGFVWAHADPTRVYGHVARWAGQWSHGGDDA